MARFARRQIIIVIRNNIIIVLVHNIVVGILVFVGVDEAVWIEIHVLLAFPPKTHKICDFFVTKFVILVKFNLIWNLNSEISYGYSAKQRHVASQSRCKFWIWLKLLNILFKIGSNHQNFVRKILKTARKFVSGRVCLRIPSKCSPRRCRSCAYHCKSVISTPHHSGSHPYKPRKCEEYHWERELCSRNIDVFKLQTIFNNPPKIDGGIPAANIVVADF